MFVIFLLLISVRRCITPFGEEEEQEFYLGDNGIPRDYYFTPHNLKPKELFMYIAEMFYLIDISYLIDILLFLLFIGIITYCIWGTNKRVKKKICILGGTFGIMVVCLFIFGMLIPGLMIGEGMCRSGPSPHKCLVPYIKSWVL
jgi:hypothetical protein